MNILLSCVGRRSYMVSYFKEVIGNQGKIIATNSELLATGMAFADSAYLTPRIDDPDYINKLLEICLKEKVKMIVSLFDIDLPVISKNKKLFEKHNIKIVVSDFDVIDIANDKWKTYLFLKENGFNTPKTFIDLDVAISAIENKEIKFPLFVKPRWGMGSLSVYKVDSIKELNFFYDFSIKNISQSYLSILSNEDLNKCIIIQEGIKSKEYGLDVFNDLDGNNLITVIKEKIAMRSGETDGAIVVDEPILKDLSLQLAEKLNHIGNLDVDVLFDGDKAYVLEFNARFGGGYPFTHLAGTNLVKAVVDMVCGQDVKINEPSVGCLGMKAINPVICSFD